MLQCICCRGVGEGEGGGFGWQLGFVSQLRLGTPMSAVYTLLIEDMYLNLYLFYFMNMTYAK